MKLRIPLRQWAATLCAALIAVAAQAADKKPNILFIVSDDTGYGDLGPYGGGAGRGMPTPSIDRMAAEIAPEGRTGEYMGIAQLPWFLTKVLVPLLKRPDFHVRLDALGSAAWDLCWMRTTRRWPGRPSRCSGRASSSWRR